jgi:CRISPR/Cas system-associated protein Cas5 (RAMP superfamily)
MPCSGRTTISKALCHKKEFQYIDAASCIKYTFRPKQDGEHIQQYQDKYHEYLAARIKVNPSICIDNVLESMKAYEDCATHFIIDGIYSPKDFVHLFDINNDIIVFVNRTDNIEEFNDSESISVSVIRDYCFWLSSASLISKDRWIEYIFKIPGEWSGAVKMLGSKNSVFIARSIDKVITHLQETLISKISLPDHQS